MGVERAVLVVCATLGWASCGARTGLASRCEADPCDAGAGEDASLTCATGFVAEDGRCVDVDECLQGPCDHNATCANTPGAYECECTAGFEGDGKICTPGRCPTTPVTFDFSAGGQGVPQPFVVPGSCTLAHVELWGAGGGGSDVWGGGAAYARGTLRLPSDRAIHARDPDPHPALSPADVGEGGNTPRRLTPAAAERG